MLIRFCCLDFGDQPHRFRNYDQLSLRFDGQPVVLVGANGAGKTNLMEAVSLLRRGVAYGGPIRQLQRGHLFRHAAGWSISARIETLTGRFRPEQAFGRRYQRKAAAVIRIDGVDQPQMALAERLAVSWLTLKWMMFWHHLHRNVAAF